MNWFYHEKTGRNSYAYITKTLQYSKKNGFWSKIILQGLNEKETWKAYEKQVCEMLLLINLVFSIF